MKCPAIGGNEADRNTTAGNKKIFKIEDSLMEFASATPRKKKVRLLRTRLLKLGQYRY
jgi:hypothetical protein